MKKVISIILSVILFSSTIAFARGSTTSQTNESKVYFLGDVMLSRDIGAYNKKGGYLRMFNEYNPFEGIKDSIIYLNLESPFSNPDKDFSRRTFSFGANIKNIAFINKLKEGGNTIVVSIANNHIMNSGKAGFELTKKTLAENNIIFVGNAGPKLVNKAGVNYCFNAYTYDGGKNGVNGIVEKNIDKDLDTMRDMGCDKKIVGLHWGAEYKYNSDSKQKLLAKSILSYGATFIAGTHSHINGLTETIDGKSVVYSMGNALFDQDYLVLGCSKGMDCIYDDKYKRKAIPTYIGKVYSVSFNKVGSSVSIFNTYRMNKGIFKKY